MANLKKLYWSPQFKRAAPVKSLRRPLAHGDWLSVVTHLDPKYGGLSAAVPALADAVSQAGYSSTSIAGFCAASERFRPVTANNVPVDHMPLGRLRWIGSSLERKAFAGIINQSAGVHIHGIWDLSTVAAAWMARALKKPYIISAHGMLERWELSNKKVKKTIYAALIERRNLQSANCLHALTRAEARDYRNFGLTNPIAVIPNGVTIPPHLSSDLFLERFPDLCGKRLILFLGRINLKKGLALLTEAWARVANEFPDAHLILAGPDSNGTRAELEKQLTGLGISNRTTFTGMLNQELKWSAFAASECFVLPSYSEGLSVAVLEAMGAGLPVIVTRQCNLQEIAERGCGWVIQPILDDLVSALNEFLRAPSREVVDMGARGKNLALSSFSWPVIGQQMSDVYEWLNGGRRPALAIY